MATGPRKLLGQILKDMEIVTEAQVKKALAIQREKGGAIGKILVSLGHATEEEVLLALGAQFGMEVINLNELNIPQEIIQRVPASTARVYKIIPVKFDSNTLTVAMANPLNISVLDDLRFMLACEVHGAVSDEKAVEEALDKYYSKKGMSTVLNGIDGTDIEADVEISETESKAVSIYSTEAMAGQTPVKKLLNLILLHAIKDQASDIHFEPFENEFKVRYRVDGVLYEMTPPPLNLAASIISRIKVLSNLNISETRLPQDGRIPLNVEGKMVDIRVSTLPTMFGESVVMRVLDKSVVALDLDNIGLRNEESQLIKNLMSLPNGIVIVTGPTGSGKTTTLYSSLNYINDVDWKIITTEDPVEYDLPGVIQCPIDDKIGVTYAACLRSILRQDPDIILVGEIRDQETVRMAIEASLTGHLVLTTLHTNDAPSSITRLLDLGIESFLITATLESIVAQRLVRRICIQCKEEYEPTEESLMELNLTLDDVKGKKFHYGKGCTACNNLGYRGRTAIFEIMLVSGKVRQIINQRASTGKLRIAAREEGMRSLRDSGLLAIYDGLTTIEEVVRETLFAE